jgi:hypothetical protein
VSQNAVKLGKPVSEDCATWSTAEVGRPQSPLPPAPLFPPFMVNQCSPPAPAVATPPPGQTFAPLPFVHFTNQTLRQIVHTSIGGTKVRVFISNAYGSAPVTIGAGHIALREKGGAMPGTRRWPTRSTSLYSSNKDHKPARLQHRATVAIGPEAETTATRHGGLFLGSTRRRGARPNHRWPPRPRPRPQSK